MGTVDWRMGYCASQAAPNQESLHKHKPSVVQFPLTQGGLQVVDSVIVKE